MEELKINIPKEIKIKVGGHNEVKNHGELKDLDFEKSKHTGFQKELTFDERPTEESTNPVTSGGVFDYVKTSVANKLVYRGEVAEVPESPEVGVYKISSTTTEEIVVNPNYIYGGTITLDLSYSGLIHEGQTFTAVLNDGTEISNTVSYVFEGDDITVDLNGFELQDYEVATLTFYNQVIRYSLKFYDGIAWLDLTSDDKVDLSEYVNSVNGKTGDVSLSIEDFNGGLLSVDDGAGILKFTDDMVEFLVSPEKLYYYTKAYQGTNFWVDKRGLVISGNPFGDEDIILQQIKWVDENDQSQGTVTTVHKLSEKLNKPTLNTSSTTSLVLEHNQEAHLGEITTLTLSMPEKIDTLYWSSFCFASGESAASLTYSDTPIIWVGDDCNADGKFTPVSNTKYEVNIKKLGDDIVARVGAY